MTSLLWIRPRLFVEVGVWLIFGLQESTYLQQLSWLHVDSNLGLLPLRGKIIKSTLRRSSLMLTPYQSRSQSLILYRDAFCQQWVFSYVLFLMILRIDCYVIMWWWLGTMDDKKDGPKERRGGAKEQQRRPSQVGGLIQVELESNSDSRNSSHQNRHPGHTPTPF